MGEIDKVLWSGDVVGECSRGVEQRERERVGGEER